MATTCWKVSGDRCLHAAVVEGWCGLIESEAYDCKRVATMIDPKAECPVSNSREATLDVEETTLDGRSTP